MTKTKTVFMHYTPGSIVDIAHASTPDGFTMTSIASQASDHEKIEALADAEFLLGFAPIVSEAVLRTAPKLKLIQVASAGYDTLDLDVLRELGIPLATSTGVNAAVVAEHTIALLLAVLRKLPQATARVADGGWSMDSPATDPFTYHDLVDKTIGIVGFGNIAQQVAKRLGGFDCHLQVYKLSKINEQQQRDFGVTQVELQELMETSDVVTLHVPLTSDSEDMIGREQLASMKSSAILINTARGAVVDEAALIEALQEGQILGAGLDTTTEEPPAPDNALRTMENVVLTPHVGGSIDTMQRVFQFCWQNIQAVLDGKTPQNLIQNE